MAVNIKTILRDLLAALYLWLIVLILFFGVLQGITPDPVPIEEMDVVKGTLQEFSTVGARNKYARFMIRTNDGRDFVLTSDLGFLNTDSNGRQGIQQAVGQVVSARYEFAPVVMFTRGGNYHRLRRLRMGDEMLVDYSHVYPYFVRNKSRIYWTQVVFHVLSISILVFLLWLRVRKIQRLDK